MTDAKIIQYHHRRMDYYDMGTPEYQEARTNFIKLVGKVRNEKKDYREEKVSDYLRPTNKQNRKFEWSAIKIPKFDYRFLIP